MKPVLAALAASLALAAHGQVSLTIIGAAYDQDFDTLASSGTGAALPSGWSFSESGINANTTYNASNGSLNTGNAYSYGATGATDRAFGGLQSGTLIPTIGVAFTNNTGLTLTGLDISYVGEQWRLGTPGRSDSLGFQYSLDATSLSDGSWMSVAALNFTSPTTTGTAGALDGNSAANRTAVAASVGSLAVDHGSTIWVRWTDTNASGADDGLAVDHFRLAAIPEPSTSALLAGALTVGALVRLRLKRRSAGPIQVSPSPCAARRAGA